jgi:hypothetical protein
MDMELDWFAADYTRFEGETWGGVGDAARDVSEKNGAAAGALLHATPKKLDTGDDDAAPSTPLISLTPLGWQCSPTPTELQSDELRAAMEPNTISRLRWFMAANQNKLLKELMGVVTLKNVNHENICVINTCIVTLIFVARRGELPRVLAELRESCQSEMRSPPPAAAGAADVVVNDLIDEEEEKQKERGGKGIFENFRELCFFWTEYYTHRGRDRLSIEFSSHVRFAEWQSLVARLCADDGSPDSLLRRKIPLPRSPYHVVKSK